MSLKEYIGRFLLFLKRFLKQLSVYSR